MQDYHPQKIVVEAEVRELPLSRRILTAFPDIPVEEIPSLESYKEAQPITGAKKILALARSRGDLLKPFPKIPHALNLGDFVFNPISNCHLECTYCILQSYLKNNPVLTLFADVESFLASIARLSRENPEKSLRIGTGELSDSLALDHLTALSTHFVPHFAQLTNAYLELKTKSDCIENLLSLDHKGRTVVSWSLAPEEIVVREELKCASLNDRLAAARRLQNLGYPIGLHLDPLLYGPQWESDYRGLVERISQSFDPKRIAWVSIGSLRFDKELKKIAAQRFPHTKIFADDFIPAPDGKMRYFKTIRLEMYRYVWRLLQEWSGEFPRYLCMEPPWVWEEVLKANPPSATEMEGTLVRHLETLRVAS